VVWKKESSLKNYNKGRKIHPIGKEIILIYFPLGWKSETK